VPFSVGTELLARAEKGQIDDANKLGWGQRCSRILAEASERAGWSEEKKGIEKEGGWRWDCACSIMQGRAGEKMG
jgi:hypothetical protein